MAKDVAKGKMTEEEKKAALGRISTTTKLSDFSSVDFVIEVWELVFKKATEFESQDQGV